MIVAFWAVRSLRITTLSACNESISASAASNRPVIVTLRASRSSISASAAVRESLISTLSASRFLMSALTAVNESFTVTKSDCKSSIRPLTALSSIVSTLSAIIISNSEIFVPRVSTSISLAEGDVRLPVTVAVWFLTITITRSLSSTFVVAAIGVRSSEPSILTYFFPSYTTTVPYTVFSLFTGLSSLVAFMNCEIRPASNCI